MELEPWLDREPGRKGAIDVENWAEIRRLHRAKGLRFKAIARRLLLRVVEVRRHPHRQFGKRIRLAFRVAVADTTDNGRPDIYVMRSIPRDSVTRAGDTRGRPSAATLTDLLLLNRGAHDNYEVLSVPAAPVESAGKPDDVVSIEHDRDGLAAFHVLQGAGSVPAPFRLIAIQ